MQPSSPPSGAPDEERDDKPDPERLFRPKSADEYQLAPLRGERPPAPPWVEEALSNEPERTMLEVEGAAIEVLCWGEKTLPGLVLLHGSRASADWWSITAPLLSSDYRVVALSSSGMGGSERRESYSVSQFAREAIVVAEDQNLFAGSRKPVFVAHSFGGYAALSACTMDDGRIGAIVLVDTLLQDVLTSEQPWRTAKPEPRRSYPTIADALARFRLVPSRPTDCLWALDEIARRSLRQIPDTGEWTWQFDNALFSRMIPEDLSNFASVTTPIAVIRGEFSELYQKSVGDRIESLFGTGIPDVVIPQAGHHIMIDQPLALTAALRAILGTWPALPGANRRSRLGIGDNSGA